MRERRIGVIVASEAELDAFVNVFGPIDSSNKCFGYWVYIYNYPDQMTTIYLTLSGYGEIAAAATTQYLISNFGVTEIINYGVAGALKDDLFPMDIGIVKKAVHYGLDLSGGGKYPVGRYSNQDDLYLRPKIEALRMPAAVKLRRFVCASADKFVYGGEPKRQLAKDFGADICEMEAAGIILTCNKNYMPCSLIKAISDGVDEDEEAFDLNVYAASTECAKLLYRLLLET